jgi:hypothetical protein
MAQLAAARTSEDIAPVPRSDVAVPVVVRPKAVQLVESPHCSLCDDPLGDRSSGSQLVSPHDGARVVVCRTCRRAALSEGYRPDR